MFVRSVARLSGWVSAYQAPHVEPETLTMVGPLLKSKKWRGGGGTCPSHLILNLVSSCSSIERVFAFEKRIKT